MTEAKLKPGGWKHAAGRLLLKSRCISSLWWSASVHVQTRGAHPFCPIPHDFDHICTLAQNKPESLPRKGSFDVAESECWPCDDLWMIEESQRIAAIKDDSQRHRELKRWYGLLSRIQRSWVLLTSLVRGISRHEKDDKLLVQLIPATATMANVVAAETSRWHRSLVDSDLLDVVDRLSKLCRQRRLSPDELIGPPGTRAISPWLAAQIAHRIGQEIDTNFHRHAAEKHHDWILEPGRGNVESIVRDFVANLWCACMGGEAIPRPLLDKVAEFRGAYPESIIEEVNQRIEEAKRWIEFIESGANPSVGSSDREIALGWQRDEYRALVQLLEAMQPLCEQPEAAEQDETASIRHAPEVAMVRERLVGKVLAIVGGDRRERDCDRIREAFGLSECRWKSVRESSPSLEKLGWVLAEPKPTIVLIHTGFLRHAHVDFKDVCRAEGIECQLIPAHQGFGVNPIAKLLVEAWRRIEGRPPRPDELSTT